MEQQHYYNDASWSWKKICWTVSKNISWASVGIEPSLMGLGPIEAVKAAVKRANWKIDEIDLFEINEAFAAQSIAVINELKIDKNKVNVKGVLLLGHPIGLLSRILVTRKWKDKIKRSPLYVLVAEWV